MREVPAAPGGRSRWRPVTCLCWFSPLAASDQADILGDPQSHPLPRARRAALHAGPCELAPSLRVRAGGAVACRGDLAGRVVPSFCPLRPPARRSSSLSSCCHTHSLLISVHPCPPPTPAPRAPVFLALACCQLEAEFASGLREKSRAASRWEAGVCAAPAGDCAGRESPTLGAGSPPSVPSWGRGRGASS